MNNTQSFSLPFAFRKASAALVLAGFLAGFMPGLLHQPVAVHAAAPCELAPRLRVGNAVTVIDGTPNRLRRGPGLGYDKLAGQMVPGDVWYVQEGPICTDGMNWYRVAAYDFEGWSSEGSPATGYYLGKTTRKPAEGAAVSSCRSVLLAIGDKVTVIDGTPQRIRRNPDKSAPVVAWFNPGRTMKIVKGPRCADGWVWWQVANAKGKVVGWTSEGDGAKAWLGKSGSPTGGGASAAGKSTVKFTGDYAVNTTGDYQVNFSGDGEAVTVTLAGLVAGSAAYVGSLPSQAHLRVTLPATGTARTGVAKLGLAGHLNCEAGGQAEITGTLAGKPIRFACPDSLVQPTLQTEPVTYVAPFSTGAPLTIDLNLRAWDQTPGGSAQVGIDLLDLSIAPQ